MKHKEHIDLPGKPIAFALAAFLVVFFSSLAVGFFAVVLAVGWRPIVDILAAAFG